jgi:D-glycero-D-manno-heptose 1,7-bisphosphate phosphatase
VKSDKSAKSEFRPCFFFDRDGVVNYRLAKAYIREIQEFNFLPEFIEFFLKIKSEGNLAILVTNQQGISKGLMTDEELDKVHDYMQTKLIELTESKFDDIFVCTDLAESSNYRRKPNPGMFFEAIEKWNIQPEESWMIGDRHSDVIAGKKAGLNTILLGHYKKEDYPEADYVFKNLYIAYDTLFRK